MKMPKKIGEFVITIVDSHENTTNVLENFDDMEDMENAYLAVDLQPTRLRFGTS